MNYPSDKELNLLFQKGLKYYKGKDFFLAHEYWEDLWHNNHIKDRLFIQGLIQLAASFYKIQSGNLKGARSLLQKSLNKFEQFDGIHYNINVDKLKPKLYTISEHLNVIESTDHFQMDMVPGLE